MKKFPLNSNLKSLRTTGLGRGTPESWGGGRPSWSKRTVIVGVRAIRGQRRISSLATSKRCRAHLGIPRCLRKIATMKRTIRFWKRWWRLLGKKWRTSSGRRAAEATRTPKTAISRQTGAQTVSQARTTLACRPQSSMLTTTWGQPREVNTVP